MSRLLLLPILLIILLAASLIWSGGGIQHKADFVFINRGEIGTLDPNRMSWLQDIRMGYAIWEGLYTLDPQTLEPIPGCAGAIDISDDKTVYTFHIRPEARWHNGESVTANDFVFAWKRMLEQPGDYTYLLYYIRGAQEYSEQFTAGSRPAFDRVGVEVIDPRTLRVTLRHPVTFFPDLCAFPPFFPLHEPSMRPFAQTGAERRTIYAQQFTRPPNLVGNGPYRLDSWQFKRRIRLVASDYYWDRANVRSGIIDMLSVDDRLAAFLKYDSGAVDWLAEVTGDIAAELRARGRNDLRVFPGFGTYFYSLNCQEKLPDGRKNPLADVRVRRALSMAIDKQPIVENITRLGEMPALTYIPPGIFAGHDSPRGLPFDIAQARRLLVEAGYPNGANFPRVSILFNSEGQHPDVAQYVRKQWADHLGIELDLEGVEIKTFRQRLHNKDYAIARASWIGDYNDPSTFTDKYLSVSENNDSGWKHAEYDDLCNSAAPEPDPAKRSRMLTAAEQILCNEAPIIPIYYYVNAYLFRDDVKGVPTNPRNMVIFKAVSAGR